MNSYVQKKQQVDSKFTLKYLINKSGMIDDIKAVLNDKAEIISKPIDIIDLPIICINIITFYL